MAMKCALINYALKKNAEMKADAQKKKDEVINSRLPMLPDLKALDEEAIRQLCRELHGMTHSILISMTHII